MPRVSIIIVNYNGSGLITSCLQSIEKQLFTDYEIIVIDNASSDGSLEEVRTFLGERTIGKQTEIIASRENLGFAGGNNEGFRHARGEYIALLNNDAEADAAWLSELVGAMDNDRAVGICASKMLVFGTNIIDSAGDGFATSLKGFKRGEGEEGETYSRQEYVFGACAGAALYRTAMLQETGFFDEAFFLIHEDTDLNFRAQRAGWKVLYVPSAVVHHKVRSSIGHMSDSAVYYTLRNSEYVRIKNIPLMVFLRNLPAFILGLITEFVYFVFRHGGIKVYLRAKADAIRNLSPLIAKRRNVMKITKGDTAPLQPLFTSVWNRQFFLSKLRKFRG